MSESVYTKVRKGDLPGYVLYQDGICFVILSIAPNNPGHALVIPIEEVTQWILLDKTTLKHCVAVAQEIGKIQMEIYNPKRIELAIVGLDVEHTHLHVFPVYKIEDVDHSAAKKANLDDLGSEAEKISKVIESQGGIKLS